MAAANFPVSLAFVWKPQYDSPAQGYHVTDHDTGGGTKGGVIEPTWADACKKGVVSGTLAAATSAQLSDVLRSEIWGTACDDLPNGLDLALFNGRMMSGGYPKIFQRAIGLSGDDVDGNIGPYTISVARQRNPATLIWTLAALHHTYLTKLLAWHEFGAGWTTRVDAARVLALQLVGVS